MSQRGPNGIHEANNGNGQPSAASQQTDEASPHPGAESHTGSPRRPKSEREDAFDMGLWLLQGLVGLSEELRHSDLGLPEEFWVHAYAARREALLAARALVDAALESCASAEHAAAPETKKPPQRGQVSIDFG